MDYKGRKYRKLYAHLCNLPFREWKASFADIEVIIGDHLPASARRHRASWANDITQARARAWLAAGWETAQVNMDAETLLFRRNDPSARGRRTFDAALPGQSLASELNRPNLHRGEHFVTDMQSRTSGDALAALDQLQTSLEARGVDLPAWARDLRAERRVIDP